MQSYNPSVMFNVFYGLMCRCFDFPFLHQIFNIYYYTTISVIIIIIP